MLGWIFTDLYRTSCCVFTLNCLIHTRRAWILEISYNWDSTVILLIVYWIFLWNITEYVSLKNSDICAFLICNCIWFLSAQSLAVGNLPNIVGPTCLQIFPKMIATYSACMHSGIGIYCCLNAGNRWPCAFEY